MRAAARGLVVGIGLSSVGYVAVPYAAALGALLCLFGLRWRFSSLQAVNVGVLLGLVLAAGLLSLSFLEVVCVLVIYLFVHRSLTFRSGDDQLLLFFAALSLCLLSTTTQEPWFMGLWLTVTVVSPTLLGKKVPVHSAVVVLVVATAVFFLLPRFSGITTSSEGAFVGFSPTIQLGELSTLLDDPAIVLMITGKTPPARYWRGVALDQFDGTKWWSSTPPHESLAAPIAQGAARFSVYKEPGSRVLFTPSFPAMLVSEETLSVDSQGAYWASTTEAVSYEVVASDFKVKVQTPSQFLGLPPSLPETVRSLGAELVVGANTDQERLQRLVGSLSSHEYARTEIGDPIDTLSSFMLDETSKGHCELFASALVVLARSAKLPARLVNGFVEPVYDDVSGAWVVRRQNAHAWAEVAVNGVWTRVDATPQQSPVVLPRIEQVFTDQVVGFDSARQQLIWRRFTSMSWVVGGSLVLGFGALLTFLVVRLFGARRQTVAQQVISKGQGAAVHELLLRSFEVAQRLTGPAPSHLPPVAEAVWYGSNNPKLHEMEELAWLYYGVLFDEGDEVVATKRALEIFRALETTVSKGEEG